MRMEHKHKKDCKGGKECNFSSSLEPDFKKVEYETEETVVVPIKDRCNQCGNVIGEERHVFKFSHIEE